MIFSDLFFLYIFLPVCVALYFISKNAAYRNIVLLVFSLLFYAWGAPLALPLLIFAAFVNWLCGHAVFRFRGKAAAKLFTALGIVFDLGILVVFKYTGFIVENFNAATGLSLAVPHMMLPLGISFYTFRLVSYLLDVSWEKTEPERGFFRFLLYVSLFPSVVSGPIVRYTEISGSLGERRISVSDLCAGGSRVIVGLAKKVIIADSLAAVTAELFGADVTAVTVVGCWYGAAVYALQMYFDFSGYSDMAIGLARIFGFTYPENFNYPFVCKSIAEFWQRWHITLGAFFRDYLLYVPIFGQQRKYAALFLVWFSTGIWHGASWNFIFWGLYFGLFVLGENLLGRKRMKRIPVVLRHIYTKLVIIVGFGIFYFRDTKQLFSFLRGLVGANGNAFFGETVLHSAANNIFLLLAALLFCLPVVPWLRKKLAASPAGLYASGVITCVSDLAMLAVSSVMLVSATSNPFLYSQF